tara:strand:- start:115 stop:384 length:270 start_codon:yes stop_codon:yes gene_type:complete
MVFHFSFSHLGWGSVFLCRNSDPTLTHPVKRRQVVYVAVLMELSDDFEVGGCTGYFSCFHKLLPLDGEGFQTTIFLTQMEQHGENPDMG